MDTFSNLDDKDPFSGITLVCPQDSIKKVTYPQILRINYLSSLRSFHPHRTFDIGSHTVCKSLFEGLTRVNSEGKVQLAGAEVLEIYASGTESTFTFTLRPFTWSNGKKVTSFDFLRSWEKILSSKSFHAKRFFHIKNAELFYHGKVPARELGIYTPCDKKIVIEVEHSSVPFLQLLADPIYSPLYDPESENEPTIFNGPFIVENHDLEKELILSKNPLYWDQGKVKLEQVNIHFIENKKTVLSMYKKNKLDWLGTPFSDVLHEEKTSFPNIKSKKATAPFWLFCNIENPKLKSEKIRLALSYAMDREEIITKSLPDQRAMHTIFPQEFSYLSEEEFIQTDREKAKELFEAGLKEIGLNRNDFQLTLNHSNIFEQEKLALSLKQQWEDTLGIQILLEKDDWNRFYSKIKSKNYEIGGFYLYNTYDDPSYFMEYFEKSYHNHSGWECEDYQRFFDLGRRSIEKEVRTYCFKNAELILMKKMPVIPVYNHTHLYVAKDNLKNFASPTFNYIDFKWVYFDD